MKDLDKYRGCLIGGAVGNALGYAVEFLPDSAIFQRYGEQGITEYERIDGVAQISDDTQMTLFTANGLLLGATQRMAQGDKGPYPFYIGLCYKDWLKTQSVENGCSTPDYAWLNHIPAMNHTRAPGGTCLDALSRDKLGSVKAIPEKFLTHLELKDIILEMADDLFHDRRIPEHGDCRKSSAGLHS